MYCGSCLHDNTLAAALLDLGEDVLLVPTYTPLRTDEEDAQTPTCSSAASTSTCNNTLRCSATRRGSSTRCWTGPASYAGPRRLAVRRQGAKARRSDRFHARRRARAATQGNSQAHPLTSGKARPDVVHLSNAMLLGMAREILRLDIPVVCSLSGEDIFLEKLVEPFYSQAECAACREIRAFVALNNYYSDFMADYLALPRCADPRDPARLEPGRPWIAHCRRQRHIHDRLSWPHLSRQGTAPPHRRGRVALSPRADLPPFRIRAAGYLSRMDQPYLDAIHDRVKGWSKPEAFEYLGELTRAEKIAFLQSLDVMSLPTVYRESKGLSVLEAMANGVAVVVPEHGTFPELIRHAGGGLLHAPDDPQALADVLGQLILDPARASQLGGTGQQTVHRDFTARIMAENTLGLYRQVLSERRSG